MQTHPSKCNLPRNQLTMHKAPAVNHGGSPRRHSHACCAQAAAVAPTACAFQQLSWRGIPHKDCQVGWQGRHAILLCAR